MIRILDSFISDKIAAGEVIERPVSAAKELIENSIDAGASSIIVEIRGGGSLYMRITDDGCGIPSDEIETAFLRHATSKISDITDLDNIQSLGFRGEALASISAVSRLTIVSRTEEEKFGSKLILHAGKLISKEKVGANKGTTIVVEDLFYNTPARRKFMKSDAREASAIIELVQHYAIAYSDKRFMMINNGKTLFSTQGNGDTNAVIKSLYPDNAHSDLIAVNSENVKGFISDPGTTLSSRRGQLFYVNGRRVSSKTIEKALADAYGDRVFSGYPVAILFIELDPRELDVNIHPGKREILFLHANDVIKDVSSSVSDALSSSLSVPKADIAAGAHYSSYETSSSPRYAESSSDHHVTYKPLHDDSFEAETEQTSIRDYLSSIKRDDAATKIYDADATFDTSDTGDTADAYEGSIAADTISSASTASDDNSAALPKEFDFSSLVIKGYIFNTYIIAESGEAAYLFDQHAAHERIFYEKLLSVYKSDEKLSQPILSPLVINVSADSYLFKDEIIEALASIGYDISDFGGGSFMIRAIPSFMQLSEAELFAAEFCNSSGYGKADNSAVIDKIILKSCKSAVKGGDSLSDLEIKKLLDDLSACSNPYSCPHGRPTFVKLTKYEIERIFKRK